MSTENERRGRHIHSVLLLLDPGGRAMGREEEAHRELRGRGHVGWQEHRTLRRHIHDDGYYYTKNNRLAILSSDI